MGRTRGAASGGNQALATWRTVLLSSGEQRVIDAGAHAGVQARVITVWGSPFGPNQEAVVKTLERRMLRHYGHAGPLFAEWVLNHQSAWGAWEHAFERLEQRLMGRAPGDPVAQRLAGPCAAIGLAGALFHRALGLPEPRMAWDAAVAVFDEQLTAARESTAERALRIVLDWVAARTQSTGLVEDHGLVVGCWFPWDRDRQWQSVPRHLYLLRSTVEAILRSEKMATSVLFEWRDLHWLATESGRLTVKMSTYVESQLNSTRALRLDLTNIPSDLRPQHFRGTLDYTPDVF
jgi:hypothetical protein